MNITFGILTAYEEPSRVAEVVKSIQDLKIPGAEIIIAASYNDKEPIQDIRHIYTDGWITKKKNLIADVATHDNLVLLHDYYLFHPEWYREYRRFGFEWDICSNPQILMNGKRHFTDWVVWDSPIYPRYYSLSYDDWSQTKYQYISGGYFLVKRDFLREFPLNEEMQPGSPEDVEWSLRVRDHALIKCNPYAVVNHNKVHRDCK